MPSDIDAHEMPTWHALSAHARLAGDRHAIRAAALLLLVQPAFTYAPPLQALFETRALAVSHWLTILPVAVTIFLLVELEKWVLRRHFAGLR